MRSDRPRSQLLFMSAFVFALSAGAGHAQADHSDPWEPANRKLYAVHQTLDHLLFRPIAHVYGWLPKPVRKVIHNFNSNLGEPAVFANDLLQGHVGTAASTLGRFAINSTVGVGGLVDVAKRGRIPHHDNTFGTTLGRWGAKPGPYMFVPILGPTSVRDALGGVVNIFLSPVYYANYPARTGVSIATTVTSGLDMRLQAQQALDTIQQTSTDPYATLRSYYEQSREAEVHGVNKNLETLPDFDAPDAPPPSGAQPAPQAQPQPSPDAAAAPPASAEPAPAPPQAAPEPPGAAPVP